MRIHARNQNALVFAFLHEVAESTICHSIYMRLGVFPSTAPVHSHVLVGVYWQRAVRIDCDQEQARVRLSSFSEQSRLLLAPPTYIDEICFISHMKVVDNRGLVQMCELCHIVCLIEFGWVDFIHHLCIHLSLLHTVSGPLHDSLQIHTLPSSHCTRRWPLLISCTTQPLVKAHFGSRSQTYRLPEKSFSPSNLRILS